MSVSPDPHLYAEFEQQSRRLRRTLVTGMVGVALLLGAMAVAWFGDPTPRGKAIAVAIPLGMAVLVFDIFRPRRRRRPENTL